VHHGTGYPSGHALTAATLALGLSVIAWRHIPSRGLAIAVIVVLIGLGLLVGWARIWSGAHWPSDVVGGYLFGVATVAIGVILLNRQIRATATPG
jgi:undecaprenyl-diphosphatase